MIKKRIIPALLYNGISLVKSRRFESWRIVSSIPEAIRVFNLRQVDELIFLDIKASIQGSGPDFRLIDEFADYCFMPLTIGGGITNVEDIRRLLQVGADKVVINSSAFRDPEFITKAAKMFGSQCISVSIDVQKEASGKYSVVSNAGTKNEKIEPQVHALHMEERGAGEIFLTSIDNDGVMKGYDLTLIKDVADVLSIPLIVAGGAGSYEHLHEAFSVADVSAVSASSIFHFTEQTPLAAKRYLASRNIPVRR